MADQKLIERLYKKMLLIREVEQEIVDTYFTDVIKSPVHLSIGQEAVAVAACDPLNHDDLISNTYRCHATYLAKGGDLNAMMAELYGKRDGCAAGKAGSMHLVDMAQGVLGSSAVVGTTIPVAVGYALALQREAEKTGKQRVIVAMFGDGATEEGCFSESINFAALHRLPILFLCENNGLAIHTPLEKRWSTKHLCARVATYGIPAHAIRDQDIFTMHAWVNQTLADIRQGRGAAFLECDTYRWMEHVGPLNDHDACYRSQEEFEQWRARDQLVRLGDLLDREQRQGIEKEVQQMIAHAVEFAKNSTFPATEQELYANVYA
jgi:TPP-dependent pyruvate/acetoin dehydrogenase alpha subunit